MIVIGNEILSGRTKDKNIGWVADKLNSIGINLIEARIIPDNQDVIISTIQELSKKVDYIFTSGGIGPTHDDITTVAIAKAFRVSVEKNKEALIRLEEHYKGTGVKLNSARLKMADIPKGAKLIDNPVSAAPGFNIKNVYVMAGVPIIMQAMLDGIIKTIENGSKTISISIGCNIGEGNIAKGLEKIETSQKNIEIGCYPWFRAGLAGTNVVIRSLDKQACAMAAEKVKFLIREFGGEPQIIS
jgi:molybdenum cofactor synthesis domain-containing protein